MSLHCALSTYYTRYQYPLMYPLVSRRTFVAHISWPRFGVLLCCGGTVCLLQSRFLHLLQQLGSVLSILNNYLCTRIQDRYRGMHCIFHPALGESFQKKIRSIYCIYGTSTRYLVPGTWYPLWYIEPSLNIPQAQVLGTYEGG